MKNKNIALTLLLIISTIAVFGQNCTISGTVKDMQSGETLVGANVYLQETLKGTATDYYGKYSITEMSGKYTMICTFIGYDTLIKPISLTSNITLDIELKALSTMIQGVEISVKREDKNVKSTEVGTIDIPMKRIEKLPVVFGEQDILKTIQLLPGIQAGGEGSNTFYVRGGGSDQNLILVDGATVYNPSHAAGFFSIFNSNVVNSAEIIKAGMAPEYGGRMSSVLNIEILEGDKYNYKGKVGIGLLSSHAQVEGPIQREKSSFSFAARRTYADVVIKPFLSKNAEAKGLGCYFYDLNGKLSFQLSKKDNLTVTAYHGKDYFKYDEQKMSFGIDMNWQNTIGIVKWNHIFSPKLYFDVSANVTDYQLNTAAREQMYSIVYNSNVRDYVARTDWTIVPDSSNKIKIGASFTRHKYYPTKMDVKSGNTRFQTVDGMLYHANEAVLYAQHDWKINSWFQVLYGLRYTYFAHVGPFKRYIIDDYYNMNNIDSIMYNKGDIIKDYHLLEPRVNMRFQLAENKSIKASYTLNRQTSNLVSLMDSSMPSDIWLPSTDLIQPQLTHHFSAGYFHNFLDNAIETSFEIYYKKMHYLLELNPAVNLMSLISTNLDYGFISGDGQGYGAELFVNKTMGKFTGWIGYTLSWTTRNFDKIT